MQGENLKLKHIHTFAINYKQGIITNLNLALIS